uniref:Uncharacterized protein n=1 Tax=Arion vulgaris TaxID=1028688 RepID=A0A0B7A9L6_9EUPU
MDFLNFSISIRCMFKKATHSSNGTAPAELLPAAELHNGYKWFRQSQILRKMIDKLR